MDLFFVISGFCLSYPMLESLRQNRATRFDIARFFTKRFVRILPSYYCAIVLFCAMLVALHLSGNVAPTPPMSQPASAYDFLRQFLFLDQPPNYINGSFWSLAIEFRWYFAFPLLLLLWIRAPRAYFGVALGSVLAFHLTRLHALDFATLPALMLGIVAADLRARRANIAGAAIAGLLASGAAALWVEPSTTEGIIIQNQLAWQIAAFCFLCVSPSVGWLARVLSCRPMAFIGLASYSVYLVHEPLIALMELRGFGPWLASAAALLAGYAFFLIAERPFVDSPLRTMIDKATPHVRVFLKWIGMQPIVEIEPGVVQTRRQAAA
ncbi:MAG: acyltransferase [Candidatus Eremiobacteraeota bacterium]|nr:acyltransferase [Candidatus Eremiobacteraeota bacterium]MBC5827982.1 acyltransferase [Candidatus Eremiobacteraeota bacterium]